MANTVRENILGNVKTTLEGITVVLGFANTIASVQRWDMRGKTSATTPYITIAAGTELKDPAPYPLYTCRMTVFVIVWVRQLSSDVTKTDSLFSLIVGDIEKALMTDPTRGGYAQNTVLRSNTPGESSDGEPEACMIIEVEILYRHRRDDPTSKT